MIDTQTVSIVESTATSLDLTTAQALALQDLGRKLLTAPSTDVDDSSKTMVECSTNNGATWRVQVRNAIGVIGLPGVQIVVRPKIPEAHLLHLLTAGGVIPRTAKSTINFDPAEGFWRLLALWYLQTLEILINRGLAYGYERRNDRLPFVRGTIDPARASLDMLRGRHGFDCSYEEFTSDMALNRTLAAATRRIARSTSLPSELRKRANRSLLHLRDVGEMLETDRQIQPDRGTTRYAGAVALARLVLSGLSPGLSGGASAGQTYLIPTPLYVESAMRQLTKEALEGVADVQKGRRRLTGTGMTINPDLVIGDDAVGDIKYKVWDGSWNRADLYQLAAFSLGFERHIALHVGFDPSKPSGPVSVGDVKIWRVRWDSRHEIDPETAALQFEIDIKAWWLDRHADALAKSVTPS